MSDWLNNARSTVTRVRTGVGQAVYLSPGNSLLARAISITVILILLVVSALIVIPLLLLAAVVFLAVFAALKVRQLLTGALNILPRQDGRRNVRVRLPAETTD